MVGDEMKKYKIKDYGLEFLEFFFDYTKEMSAKDTGKFSRKLMKGMADHVDRFGFTEESFKELANNSFTAGFLFAIEVTK